MLANGASNHNGHALNGKVTYPPCGSDYEPAPIIDVTPSQPKPKWHDAFPVYTHNSSWTDSAGISHSMTLRSDSLQDIMADLRLLKSMIHQAKKKHADDNPTQPETQPEKVVCKIHSAEMERRVSKRTGGHYHAHKLPGNDLCFGKAKS